MDLREIKKEVEALRSVIEIVAQLKESWIKPLRANTNAHLPFLQHLSEEQKVVLNLQLREFYGLAKKVEEGQRITDRLRQYARYLIELKLHQLRGNTAHAKMVTNTLLTDEFLNMKQAIKDLKEFETTVTSLVHTYNFINDSLRRTLALDEAVYFMDWSHQIHIKELQTILHTQKNLLHQLGRQFVSTITP